jgi:hypothetical protein
MPTGGGPGADDLFSPDDHDDVLNRVVMPVVASLVGPKEMEAAEVGWGPLSPERSRIGQANGWDRDLWVLVAASGQTLEWQLWQRTDTQNRPDDTLGTIAFRFAERLEQWADDCLGHGEDHEACYIIPAKPSPVPGSPTDP